MHAETNSFAVTLNDMITHSNEVIQNVLNEFSSDSSMASETEVHNLVTANVHMVEYSVFESLRLKYDALVEEREELINETFALIDSSKAANAAELQALKGRVENETNMQFASYMQEATTRIEYLETRLASCTCSS
jgi:prophage DNA circulation protein